MNVQPALTIARRALPSAAIVVAGGAGFAGAYVATNRGDFEHKDQWQTAAAAAYLVTGGIAVWAASKGLAAVKGTLTDIPKLATELEASALATASASARGKITSAARLETAREALTAHVDGQRSQLATGIALLGGAVAFGGGSLIATNLTGARLDPGILTVKLDGTVKVDEPTRVEQLTNEVTDAGKVVKGAGEVVGSAAGGVMQGIGDWFNWINPFK